MVRSIDRVDLYGGEIGLLRPDYFHDIKRVIRIFYTGEISIISNLSIVPDFFMDSDIDLSISWDFSAREKYKDVFVNMQELQRPFRILILASDKLLQLNDQDMLTFVDQLKSLKNLQSIEIKPYSVSAYNSQHNIFKGFEDFVKRFLFLLKDSSVEFINRKKIEASLSGLANAWSDDHLYITPQGNWAVLDFDANNREYFRDLQSYDEYLGWIAEEKSKVSENSFCKQCKYLGSCLSEHLQVVLPNQEGCNGFKNLLDWYSKEVQTKA